MSGGSGKPAQDGWVRWQGRATLCRCKSSKFSSSTQERACIDPSVGIHGVDTWADEAVWETRHRESLVGVASVAS